MKVFENVMVHVGIICPMAVRAYLPPKRAVVRLLILFVLVSCVSAVYSQEMFGGIIYMHTGGVIVKSKLGSPTSGFTWEEINSGGYSFIPVSGPEGSQHRVSFKAYNEDGDLFDDDEMWYNQLDPPSYINIDMNGQNNPNPSKTISLILADKSILNPTGDVRYDCYILSEEFSTNHSESSEDSDTAEPIDTKNGNNFFTESRIFVPCPGVPLEVDLTYQSVADLPIGSLGEGWRHSLEWSLDVQTNQAVLYTGDGQKNIFEEDGSGEYLPPEGQNWTLEEISTGYEVGMPGGLAYNFDTNGVLTTIYDAWGKGVECSYGTNGCLETATHSVGRQITFSNELHTASNQWRIASISVENGTSLAFDYNGDGQFTQVVEQVGANSYTSSYQYADSFLTNKINGAGFEYSYEYETGTNGLLNGKGTHLDVDGYDVDGYYEHEVEYTHPHMTDVRYSLLQRGTEQVYRYFRNQDDMLETIYGPGENISNAVTRGVNYSYSTNNEDRTEETLFDNETGETWSEWMLYDGAHNITNFSVGYGTTTPVHRLSMEYDLELNLPTTITEPDGSRTKITYTNGSPLAVKAFNSISNSYNTEYNYNTNGLLKAITNANEHAVTFGYDTNGNLSTITPDIGPVITNSYDVLGYLKTTEFQVEESEFVSRRITEFGRDAKGRVEWIGYPDSLTNYYAYNALGYLTNFVDRAGRETDYTYAPTRKLTSVTQYLEYGGSNIPVRITYDLDEQMNQLRIKEPRGRYVESYQLDIQDRVTAVTNIENQVMSIDYGIGSFINQITRFDSSTITNSYDTMGRMTTSTYNAGSTNPVTISYGYYSDSLVKSVDDNASTNSYGYNLLNRLTATTNIIGSLSSVIDYGYDPVGNVTNTVVSFGESGSISNSYEYDAAERLNVISTTTGPETQGFSFVYDPRNGEVTSLQNTNSGITCTYGYDIMERIDTITYSKANGSLIRSINYGYDAAGMITNKTITGGVDSLFLTYEYDSINRLTNEIRSASGAPSKTTGYSYDLAGNRLSKTADDNSVSYTLGIGNRLASWNASFTNNVVVDVRGTSSETIGTDDRWGELWVSNLTAQVGTKPQADGTSFLANNVAMQPGTNVYVAAIRDEAGNMGYATNTVVYSVVTNAIFLYNTAGCTTNIAHTGAGGYSNNLALKWDERYRLTSANDSTSLVEYGYDVLGRRVFRTAGGTTEYYVYNGGQIVADVDASGNLLRSYVWGMGIDNLLSFTDHTTTNTYYAIKDLQNTVIALTDSSGDVVETYDYDAYGCTKVFAADGTELTVSAYGNRYCFQGREIDWVTGLYYFRARWYNPVVGRWLSKDPIGIEGGLNQYVFCDNNPVNFVDPMGLAERGGISAGGIGNASPNPVTVYSPESGSVTVLPYGTSPSGHDWDSVEVPADSGNWEKIGPGTNIIHPKGDLRSNPMRWLDKLLNPERYEPGAFPVPPKDGEKEE